MTLHPPRPYAVTWADLDPNGHMRHSAYGDYATDADFALLAEHGFSPARFRELGFGPARLSEETHYFREVLPGETIGIRVFLAGLSPQGERWRVHHEVAGPDGHLVATLRVDGAWLNLRRRALVVPPPDLRAILENLPRTADFTVLPPLTLRDA
ncbi:thioesterase family protein [uncultured Deinococcus sp.]|uniref:acyl-CoA thioesterase n=1 Tax=uncultured Deinococcus sp. TaxID=158789 RepID=UPI0025DD0CA1|nr:thioesterase family protein [uncultured Deinococcus sp.]